MLGELHPEKGTARLGLALVAAATLLGGACAGAQGGRPGSSPGPRGALSPAPPAALPPAFSPPSGPCRPAAAPPPAPNGVRTALPAWVLASGLANPDDLLFKDDVVYVGQIDSGRVATVAPGLPVAQSTYQVPRAEGLAMIAGRLFVADQQNDRVDVIVDDAPQTFLQLTPVPGRDNLDGIAAQGDQLLVPDSPNGTLLWVDLDGRVVRSVGGFVRPTGAWPLPDGSVLVADEYGDAALKVGVDGSRTFLVRGLPIVDDVAADADGHVMVITPVTSGGRLAELVDGAAHDLAGNLLEPQGLGFDDAGNVLVTESAAGRLDLFIRTFKLVPAAGMPRVGEPLCLNLVRAPGFNDPVQLSGDGLRVLRQPGTGSEASLLLEACRPRCQVSASSGSRSDRLWITGQPAGV